MGAEEDKAGGGDKSGKSGAGDKSGKSGAGDKSRSSSVPDQPTISRNSGGDSETGPDISAVANSKSKKAASMGTVVKTQMPGEQKPEGAGGTGAGPKSGDGGAKGGVSKTQAMDGAGEAKTQMDQSTVQPPTRKEKSAPAEVTMEAAADPLLRSRRVHAKKKQRQMEPQDDEGYHAADSNRSFMEDLVEEKGGEKDASHSLLLSHLQSSRYGDELSQGTPAPEDGPRKRAGAAGQRTGLRQPHSLHPRHVAIFAFAAFWLTLVVVIEAVRTAVPLRRFSLVRDERCQWSNWTSSSGRNCLCDDYLKRESALCGKETVRCADQPCPISLRQAAKKDNCFCWSTEPCKDSRHSFGFMFLHRSRVRQCHSVHWLEGQHRLLRPCRPSVHRLPGEDFDGETQAPDANAVFDDIYACDFLHDLDHGPLAFRKKREDAELRLERDTWPCRLHHALSPKGRDPEDASVESLFSQLQCDDPDPYEPGTKPKD